MPGGGSRLRVPLLVALVVALAAALRFWGIDQGLPFPNARPDEREALEHTIGFPSGDLNPRWFVYPNLFFWVVWLWEEAVLALRRLVVETPSYATMLREDLPALLLYGRVLSAAIGTATVWLVYWVGRRVGGPRLGIVAALLLAVSFLHVRDSHALKADVHLATGVLVSLWCLARYVERPTPGRVLVAGLAIGLTTALKYPGILLLGPGYLAAVLASPHTGLRRLVPGRDVVLLGLVAIASFLAACPYLLLDWQRARETAEFSMRAVYGPRWAPKVPPGRFHALRDWLVRHTFGYHLEISLRHGVGLLMAIATPFAILGIWRPRAPFLVLAAVFCVFYYVVIGTSPVHQSRYLTPLLPLLALLMADLVERLVAAVPRPEWRTAVLVVLTLALALEPALGSVAYDRIAARTDTRVLATRWMAEHLPKGAVVAELGSLVFAIADPELPPGVERAPLPLGSTDLARFGVTHVVTHEHLLPFSTLIGGQMQAIRPRLRLLAEFSPYRDGPAGLFEREDAYYVPVADFDAVLRPGPVVHIYAYEGRR